MENIQLKIKDDSRTIETFDLIDGELLIIDIEKGFNYELFNTATNSAPQNIIAKRIDQDLLIILDESENNINGDPNEIIPDILIKDYYGSDHGEEGDTDAVGSLVGLHENGKYYAYIPETAEAGDAIGALKDNMAQAQSIGGEEIEGGFYFPWWGIYGLFAVATLFTEQGTTDRDEQVNNTNVVDSATDPNVNTSTEPNTNTDSSVNNNTDTETNKTETENSEIYTKSNDSSTLKFKATELNISMDTIAQKEHNIKVLDINNDSVNKLTISAKDILELTNDENTLVIKGDAEDSVALKGFGNLSINYENGQPQYEGSIEDSNVKILIENIDHITIVA